MLWATILLLLKITKEYPKANCYLVLLSTGLWYFRATERSFVDVV